MKLELHLNEVQRYVQYEISLRRAHGPTLPDKIQADPSNNGKRLYVTVPVRSLLSKRGLPGAGEGARA